MTDVTWITSGYPWPGQPIGGIFFRTQARSLVRHRVGVVVTSPIPWTTWPLSRVSDKWALYAAAPHRQSDDGVTILRPRYPNVPGQPDLARADRFIARATLGTRRDWQSASVIHGHYAVQAMAARHVARRLGLPYVVTFHGSDINSWPSEHPGRLPDLRRTVREAAAVLAVSEALADRVEELSGVRPTHLPIGCDVEGLVGASQPRREARESLGLPQDRYIALFVGRLSPAKGIREFVDAVISLDGVVGVVIGDGPEAGYGPVGTVSRASVTYVGLQPNATVAQYMSAADVLILPSYREGLPTVIVEAGILRLPVIASAVGGIPDLLGSDRGVLLPEISPAAVAEVVRRQMDDREGAAERASRLRDHVLEHHSADANARRLLAIYEAVA